MAEAVRAQLRSRRLDRRSARLLVGFLVGSILLGSAATALLTVIPTSALLVSLAAVPISCIPAALALLAVRSDDDPAELAALRRRLIRCRFHVRWWVFGLLLGPTTYLSGVALATLWGGTFPVRGGLLVLLPLLVLINFGEEIGWRGYALPQLQRRFSPLTSSVILGGCWAAFHLVALAQNPHQPWLYVAFGSLTLIAMSVVMTWLFNHTGSVVLMVAYHAMYDLVAIGVVPLAQNKAPLLALGCGAAVLGLVAGSLVLLAGPELGRRNRSLATS